MLEKKNEFKGLNLIGSLIKKGQQPQRERHQSVNETLRLCNVC